jgi:hypothetical protein
MYVCTQNAKNKNKKAKNFNLANTRDLDEEEKAGRM